MLKIYKNNLETDEFSRAEKITVGSWIQLVAPTEEELTQISNRVGIPKGFLQSVIDDDEKPRVDEEDGCKAILLDIPVIHKSNNMEFIKTATHGILLVRDDYIITIESQKTPFLSDFTKGKVKEFYTYKKSRFTIQIAYRIAITYLKVLRDIRKKIELAEGNMLQATKNEEILNLLGLENSLTYIITALRSNGAVLDRILRGSVISLYEEDQDLLEDAIIENNQAISMAELYRSILESMTDTVATIISNNLNTIMKFLAGITIVISIPTMVASFMGMNVDLGIFETSPFAFCHLIVISIVFSLIVAYILKKRNML